MKSLVKFKWPFLTGLLSILTVASILGAFNTANAKSPYQYELFRSEEGFGIVVFPQSRLYPELREFITEQGFVSLESGAAVMRFGSKKENITYMMPEEIQEKHHLERFIILQVLEDGHNLMVGIFDPNHGLTLPTPIYNLDAIREGVPQTIEVFRKEAGKRKL